MCGAWDEYLYLQFLTNGSPSHIVGGPKRRATRKLSPVTVILLNRGGRYYRFRRFPESENAGFTSVISVEMSNEPGRYRKPLDAFSSVKFLVPLEKSLDREMINTGVAETNSPFVFVVWNVSGFALGISARVISRVVDEETVSSRPFPRIRNSWLFPYRCPRGDEELVPVVTDALLSRRFTDDLSFDFSGFLFARGSSSSSRFRSTIAIPYMADPRFRFPRAPLGSENPAREFFQASYDGEIPREDITPIFYIRFYLKNLRRFPRGRGPIFRSRTLLSTHDVPACNVIDTGTISARAVWVRPEQIPIVRDAANITETWEPCINDLRVLQVGSIRPDSFPQALLPSRR
jgi:hypothetical protein